MTTKTKHTPGPWAVMQNPGDPADKRIYVGTVKKPIADICGLYGDESHANACLISCAPELLEALEEMVEHYCPKCYVHNGLPQRCNKRGCVLPKYKQLIARAKGGTNP